MKHITSRDNAFYKGLLKLTGNARQRRKAGQTLLDGTHLVAAYHACGGKPLHLLHTGAALQNEEVAELLRSFADVPQTLLDDALFAELSELKTVSGLLALVALPEADFAPERSGFCLLLEDIQDPGNLGSMLRSAAAAGCDAVFLSSGCADAWSPKVLRAAMGGHFVLNIVEDADLLRVAAHFGGSVFAATLAGKVTLFECDLRGRVGFAIGNEGAGLTAELQAVCQPFIIPMPGQVESLNAASAAAICVFEAVRQRS